jgi:Maltose acetyltransferase
VPNEMDKMLAGELYDSLDPELVAARDRARDLPQVGIDCINVKRTIASWTFG